MRRGHNRRSYNPHHAQTQKRRLDSVQFHDRGKPLKVRIRCGCWPPMLAGQVWKWATVLSKPEIWIQFHSWATGFPTWDGRGDSNPVQKHAGTKAQVDNPHPCVKVFTLLSEARLHHVMTSKPFCTCGCICAAPTDVWKLLTYVLMLTEHSAWVLVHKV